MFKDPTAYAAQLLAASGNDLAAAKRMCKEAIGKFPQVPLEFWLAVGNALLNSTPLDRSMDYSELTVEEFRTAMELGAGDDLPLPAGRTEDGDEFWDNNFGGFYRRPNGTFYYN